MKMGDIEHLTKLKFRKGTYGPVADLASGLQVTVDDNNSTIDVADDDRYYATFSYQMMKDKPGFVASALAQLGIQKLREQGIRVDSVRRPGAKAGLYLHPFHGRRNPNAKLGDWGFAGPVIGPVGSFHVTYQGHLRVWFENETEFEFEFLCGLLCVGNAYFGDAVVEHFDEKSLEAFEILGSVNAARGWMCRDLDPGVDTEKQQVKIVKHFLARNAKHTQTRLERAEMEFLAAKEAHREASRARRRT